MYAPSRALLALTIAAVALGTVLATAPARAFRLAVPDDAPAPAADADATNEPPAEAASSEATEAPATNAPASEPALPPPPETATEPEEMQGIEFVHAPEVPISREEAEEQEQRRLEEEMDALPPPPEPEWRLRVGAGVGLPLAGASVPYLRLLQEVEWQPTGAAPFIFGLGGAEYLLGGVLGSVGARLGAATLFCQDSVVRCQGAIHLVLGAFFGQNLVAFDAGGEGDVRFLFGALELFVRVGFGGGGGFNFLHGSGGVDAAF